MTVMALMALLLFSSRFFQPHTTLNYEKSRWLLFTAMLLAVVHYLLQIFLGFRAASDELGALVNMLFYTPAVYLVSYASLRMVSDRKHKRLYMLVGFVSVALILVCFVVGYICCMTKFFKLISMMMRSMFKKVPGIESDYDCLILEKASKIMLQAEGEYKMIDDVKTIEIEKTVTPMMVVMK